MNPFKCFVCSQDISPKKRRSLKCQNKPCNSQCHYGCDREILNPEVAKTIESYFCINCREEGGQSIIYKKEHFTRNKSTSKSTPVVITEALDDGQSESSQDTNEVYETPHDPEVAKNKTVKEPQKSQNNEENKIPQDSEIPHHEHPNKPQSPTSNDSKITEKDKNKLLMNKNQKINELEEMLQLNVKEKNKLKKELSETTINLQRVTESLRDSELQNENLTTDIHEMNLRRGEQAELKSAQLQLMKDSLAFEIEEKVRFKAKASLYEAKYNKLLEVWSESKEPNIMCHATSQTNENLDELNNLRQQLNSKSEHNISLEMEIRRLHDNSKLSVDLDNLHESLSNLESENQQLKANLKAQTNKLRKIENALNSEYESPPTDERPRPSDQPKGKTNKKPSDQLTDEKYMYSPVSNTSLNFTDHSLVNSTQRNSHQNPIEPNHRQHRRPSTTDSEPSQHSHQHNRKMSSTESEVRDNEKEQIEKKRKNIIIQGMPEMNSNRTALKEFQKLYGFITDRKLDKWDIRKIGRIGDPTEGKPRPLKIELYSMTQKIDFMRNLHHLKNYRIENLVIQHDLTSTQLKHLSEMKQEARRLESLSDNEDFYFRVRGSPGRWKIVRMPKN